MNKHDRMIDRIIKQGENLNNIFNTGIDHLTLCKQLHRLEVKGHNITVNYCNGSIESTEFEFEKLKDNIMDKVNKILDFKNKKIPLFFNSDPRGCCLKIDDKFVRDNNIKIYTDMGGYGIIAPDLREDL